MAFSPKFVCLLIVVISLSSSLEIYARESQFFSKVSRNNPNKDVEFVHLNKQEDQQQPAFIPQTTETGYGLYGHETGLNPPSSPTTTLYNMDQNNAKFDNFYSQNKYDESNFNNNNKYDESNFNNNKYDESNFNNNKYDESNFNNKYDESNFNNKYDESNFNNKYDESNFNNNKYDESNFNFNNKNKYDESNINNNKDNNYEFFKYDNNNNKNYAPELKGLSGISNNNNKNYGYNGGVKKQGMSDTRFLENGKYFYDVEAEKNFDANNNNNYMSYANNYNNNYNTKTNGYYGNNYEYYNNNNNKNGNGMQGYQNKVQEDEFDFDDQP